MPLLLELCRACLVLLILPGVDTPPNPWKERVAPARQEAESTGTPDAWFAALDAAWRADDWQTGLALARAAREKHPNAERLRGAQVRALWRASQIHEAETLAEAAPADSRDPILLCSLITINTARGQIDEARSLAARLEKIGPASASEWSAILGVRLMHDRLDGVAGLLRRVHETTDLKNGYPETYFAEALDGMTEFVEAIGPEPLNQIAAHGQARMPIMPFTNLPACDVMINGQGPFRMILDTGGSVILSLDVELAEDLGIRNLAQGSVRGVAGKDSASHALIDEVRIGSIGCRRVMARTYEVRKALMNSADGIIGTGIFARGRMTLDFTVPQVIVAPSSEESAPGIGLDFRLVGDAKMCALVELNGERAFGLFDSGADTVALSPHTARRLLPDHPLTEFAVGAMGVGKGTPPKLGTSPGINVRLAAREFADYSGLTLDVLDKLLSPVLGVHVDVLIGMPIFRNTRTVTVDFPRSRMWIEWLPEPRTGEPAANAQGQPEQGR